MWLLCEESGHALSTRLDAVNGRIEAGTRWQALLAKRIMRW